MAYTNSPLVSYTKISPNKTTNRNHDIDTITIHCVVGQCSVETLGEVFAPVGRQASSNYGVGFDGCIGMYCEEKDRSWCTSSGVNDHRAITIEVASDTKHPYAVNDKAYAAMLDLITDICKRNGIKKLVWSTSKEDRVNHKNGCNMTVHRDFSNTACPGDYLYNKHSEIAAEVNKRLEVTSETSKTVSTGTSVTVKENDVVKLTSNATYYSGAIIPSWVKVKNWIVKEVKGDRAVIDKSEDGKNSICSPVNTKFLTLVKKASASTTTQPATFNSYLVKITADALNIRKGPGINYGIAGCIRDKGTYTIVAESSGSGANKGWGKLKSGAGWISLDYCTKR